MSERQPDPEQPIDEEALAAEHDLTEHELAAIAKSRAEPHTADADDPDVS